MVFLYFGALCQMSVFFSISVLGKRLGKSMGKVAKDVKNFTQNDILEFEKSGGCVISGYSLSIGDIKVMCPKCCKI